MILMSIDQIRWLLSNKPGAVEEFPFGPQAMVYKVGGKIFGIVGVENEPVTVSLKCDPLEAEALRSEYPAITPGYHLNKRHWNTVRIDGSVPVELVDEMIDSSYELVFQSLTKAERDRITLWEPMTERRDENRRG